MNPEIDLKVALDNMPEPFKKDINMDILSTELICYMEKDSSPPTQRQLIRGARLVEMCVGGYDGIIVFDLDVGNNCR